jgi:hypothetical protein
MTPSIQLISSSTDHCDSVENQIFQKQVLEFQNLEFSNIASTSLSSLVSLQSSQILNMEADCKDDSSVSKMSWNLINIAHMITNLSNQMTTQTQSLEV